MKLEFDPFPLFRDAFTPLSIYVRKMILGESTPELEEARRDHLRRLYEAQSEDGSYNGSVADTIEALMVFYLCEIDVSQTSEAAMDFLLEKDRPASGKGRFAGLLTQMTEEDKEALGERADLVVRKGSPVYAKTGAALFFSTYFNREGDSTVVTAFRRLDQNFDRDKGLWGAYPSSNNILLAYAGHPLKRSSQTVRTAFEALKEMQKPDGSWEGDPFFFHTLHAVSHSTIPVAAEIFDAAFERVAATQHEDGTWGDENREWTTFLALDSLARKAYTTKRHGLKRFYDAHRKDILKVNRLAEAKRQAGLQQ